MKKTLIAFVFCVLLLFGGLYFSTAQIPTILPCSPITCDVTFLKTVTVEGTLTPGSIIVSSQVAQAFKAEYNITTQQGAWVHGVKVEITRAADIQPSTGCWFGGQFVLNAGSSGYTALDKPAYVLQAIFKGSNTSPNGVDIHVGRFETQSAGKVSDILYVTANAGTTIMGSLGYIATHVAPGVAMLELNAQSSTTVPAGLKFISGAGSSYTYPIDLTGITVGTADIRLSNGATIKNTTSGTLDICPLAEDDIKFFSGAGAGENNYVYIYGDQSGTAKHGRVRVATDGFLTIDGEVGWRLAKGGLTCIEGESNYVKFQDGKDLIFGNNTDYKLEYDGTNEYFLGTAGANCLGVSLPYGTWVIKKTVNHDDSSPVACATVADGYTIVAVWVEIVEVWDGNGTIEIGDGGDDNGFLPDAGITQTSTGYYGDVHQNLGAYLWDGTGTMDKTYTGADTVDAKLVVGTSTQGQAIVYTEIARKK